MTGHDRPSETTDGLRHEQAPPPTVFNDRVASQPNVDASEECSRTTVHGGQNGGGRTRCFGPGSSYVNLYFARREVFIRLSEGFPITVDEQLRRPVELIRFTHRNHPI
jgi:hypothetical protein